MLYQKIIAIIDENSSMIKKDKVEGFKALFSDFKDMDLKSEKIKGDTVFCNRCNQYLNNRYFTIKIRKGKERYNSNCDGCTAIIRALKSRVTRLNSEALKLLTTEPSKLNEIINLIEDFKGFDFTSKQEVKSIDPFKDADIFISEILSLINDDSDIDESIITGFESCKTLKQAFNYYKRYLQPLMKSLVDMSDDMSDDDNDL